MKASKFVVLAGGILGIIAFFLPMIAVTHNNTEVKVSAFQVVRGLSGIQDAVGTDDAKAQIASLDRESRAAVAEADEGIGKVKGLVYALFAPAALLVLIGGVAAGRKRFGRVAGTFALLLGVATLGIAALMRAAAAETATGAGIAITVLFLTGLLGFAGGIMGLAKPERAAA